MGGIQEFFGVNPDYSCYSKSLAGGMPLSAVVGSRKFLEPMNRLQVSTTFGGEMLSLAAALCCINEFKEQGLIGHIAQLGTLLRDGINRVAEEQESTLRVLGYDAIPFFLFDRNIESHVEQMRAFQGEMAKRGVLLRRDVNFISGVHSREQIEFTINAAAAALQALKKSSTSANPSHKQKADAR